MRKAEFSICGLCSPFFVSLVFAALMLGSAGYSAQAETVAFDSGQWVTDNAQIVDYEDRKCLAGFAFLKDVELRDGIVEVDVRVDGTRSYPGIMFRMNNRQDCERIYLRPHRAGLYPDALQYTPVFNGIAGWQLYNGTGYTSAAQVPADEWVHWKLELKGSRARFFMGDSAEPALVVNDLKHGERSGTLGLLGPPGGSALFSNFSYRELAPGEVLDFGPVPEPEYRPGVIRQWRISQTFTLSEIDMEKSPTEQGLKDVQWRNVESDPSGLLDLARFVGRSSAEPECVLAKAVIRADEPQVRDLAFGYSDAISIFVNGRLCFAGSSAYQQRDPSFLGIVGFFDSIYVPLIRGDNEILIMVAESFGGWGFMFGDGDAVFRDERVEAVSKTRDIMLTPESVIYDLARDSFYVSNFDVYGKSGAPGTQFLTKLSSDGELKVIKWVEGLNKPTGMCFFNKLLYVVERSGVAVVDPDKREVTQRFPIPGAQFLNDIAVDAAGNVYVSDSGRSVILKLRDGKPEEWLAGADLANPNSLCVIDDELIWGNSGDACLKSANLESKSVRTVAQLGTGIIDGIKPDKKGNLLVSQWEGRLYRISPNGAIEKLLDTSVPGEYIADFEFLGSKGILAVPTFTENHVSFYRVRE